MQAAEISLSGLDVEWQRLQVIAQNIANVNTSRTADGGVYRPLELVSGPKVSFDDIVNQRSSDVLKGVTVYGVEAKTGDVRRVYEPAHPHADADGFVTYPALNHAAEMTKMIKTSRAYEANLVALNISMQMYSRGLDIGKRQ